MAGVADFRGQITVLNMMASLPDDELIAINDRLNDAVNLNQTVATF